MVKVATVPGTSAKRSACIWSMAWHFRQARVGGMWRKPQARQRLAAKAYFQSLGTVHRRGTGALRVGTAWRLSMELASPSQEGRIGEVVAPRRHLVGHRGHAGGGPGPLRGGQRLRGAQDEGVGAVGQRQDRDHLPRLGPLQDVAQRDAGMRGPEVPDRRHQVRRQDALADAEPRRDSLHCPRVQTGHDGVVEVALCQAGVLERRRERFASQWDVELLAEALLPDV